MLRKRTKFFLPEAIRCGDLSLPDITIQLIFLILSRKFTQACFCSQFGKAIFDEQTLKEYGVLLKKYDSLAVRENVAVELLKKMDISAKQVLDPTLLMDADAWSEYVKPMKKPEKYVLVYQIHANRI